VPPSRPDRNDGVVPSDEGTASRPDGDLPTRLALTDRHLEILGHVARGRTNRQVGEALGISERTVRNHMRTIAKRLATTDRTHAVVLAIGHGWISVPIEPEPDIPLVQASRPAEAPS
jgi:DNA-binding NarL/FixJ family response regulator